MACVADVSTAGDYAWVRRLPPAHATADAGLLKRIRTNCATSRAIYGAMARTSLTMRVTIDDDFTPMSAFEQSFPQHVRLAWAQSRQAEFDRSWPKPKRPVWSAQRQ
jgi:hypothetical protein